MRNQVRAARYKSRGETARQIKLVDELGNRRYVLTKHQRVLSVLEKRALRYRGKRGYLNTATSDGDGIDETGTVSTEGLTDSESDGDSISSGVNFSFSSSIKQKELEEIRGVRDELLRVHGVAPGSKLEGTIRLIYENLNGINSRRE